MTQYTLLGKTYEIPKTSADFLDSYIKRLKMYISHNNISETYLDDILERIGDKLTQLETESSPIQNADIIKIVNDIGEAEDIFPKEPKDSHTQTPVQNLFQKGLKRDSENAILFGVCAGIARHISIDPLWIRILFIILVFTGGIGVIVYIVLIFLIPSDNKVKIEKNLNKDSQSGTIKQLTSMVGSSFRGIFRLILIIIFAAIGFGLIGCFIAGVVISGIVLSGSFEIGNQQFLSNIPDELEFAIPLLTVLAFVMVVAIFANIIGRDLFGKKGWLILSILTAIGFIFLTTGGIHLVKEYTWTERKTDEVSFVFTGKTIDISNELHAHNDTFQFAGNMWRHIHIEKTNSTGTTIVIRTTDRIQTKDATTAKYILDSRNMPIYSLSGNILTLGNSDGLDFKNKVPFAFPERNIEIIIPSNIEVTGEYAERYHRNMRQRHDEYRDEVEIPEIPEIPENPDNAELQ